MSLLRRAARLAARRGPALVRRAQRRRATASGTPSAPGPAYAPRADGRPDPGEVAWAWVPYEDDPSRGKDRPVLLLGERDGRWVALYLTSKDHDRDAGDEARWGRHWMDVGTGGWDSRRRPSEVRLDRLVVLEESDIRREGAALPRPVFDAVIARARQLGTV